MLEEGRLKEYLGNYDAYFAKVSRDQAPDGDLPQMTRTAADKEKKRSREEQRRLKEQKDRLKNLEKENTAREAEAAGLEARLADPETYRDPEKAAELTRQYNAVRETVERLYAEWEEMEEQEG